MFCRRSLAVWCLLVLSQTWTLSCWPWDPPWELSLKVIILLKVWNSPPWEQVHLFSFCFFFVSHSRITIWNVFNVCDPFQIVIGEQFQLIVTSSVVIAKHASGLKMLSSLYAFQSLERCTLSLHHHELECPCHSRVSASDISQQNEFIKVFKQSRRRDDDIAIVNGAMRVLLRKGVHVIEEVSLAFGGMGLKTILASQTMKQMHGKYAVLHYMEPYCFYTVYTLPMLIPKIIYLKNFWWEFAAHRVWITEERDYAGTWLPRRDGVIQEHSHSQFHLQIFPKCQVRTGRSMRNHSS